MLTGLSVTPLDCHWFQGYVNPPGPTQFVDVSTTPGEVDPVPSGGTCSFSPVNAAYAIFMAPYAIPAQIFKWPDPGLAGLYLYPVLGIFWLWLGYELFKGGK